VRAPHPAYLGFIKFIEEFRAEYIEEFIEEFLHCCCLAETL
jgi:hypothetical protein